MSSSSELKNNFFALNRILSYVLLLVIGIFLLETSVFVPVSTPCCLCSISFNSWLQVLFGLHFVTFLSFISLSGGSGSALCVFVSLSTVSDESDLVLFLSGSGVVSSLDPFFS